MVEELIDENLMAWSEEKLEENFIEADRQAIRRIPLGRFTEDVYAWTQEKSGKFSVRSAYRLMSSLQRTTNASGSGNSVGMCWKKMWKLSVPPKIWWRVIRRFIPSRLILKERHIEHIGNCETCGAAEESIFHALFQCTWAKVF
jgi:hypothetical protein